MMVIIVEVLGGEDRAGSGQGLVLTILISIK